MPLVFFKEQKAIPHSVSCGIQRWALILVGYEYVQFHLAASQSNADKQIGCSVFSDIVCKYCTNTIGEASQHGTSSFVELKVVKITFSSS